MASFARNWKILDSPWAAAIAARGLRWDFSHFQPQERIPHGYQFTKERADTLSEQIGILHNKRAIERVQPVRVPADNMFYGNMFCVPKQSGGIRPVFNLRLLNAMIFKQSFKMESIRTVKTTLRRNDWMTKIDLKDAFFHFLVHKDFRNFLRFRWKGRHYRFRVMPFGLTVSPRYFTKLLRPIVKLLRSQGIRLVIYIDDILIMATKGRIKKDTETVMQLLRILGFSINTEKSVIKPTQSMVYLGLLIKSKKMTFLVPPKKMKDIKRCIRQLLRQHRVSIRKVASVLGKIQATSDAMFPARIKTAELMAFKNQALRKASWTDMVTVPEAAKIELRWWLDCFQLWNGKAILPPKAQLSLETDASGSGWGATLDGIEIHGFWNTNEKARHNNVRELMAVKMALFAFHQQLKKKVVRIWSDNIVSVFYINKMGGKVPELRHHALQIWNWAMKNGTRVFAEFIPGKDNVVADRLSRVKRDRMDWKLNPQVFERINDIWGPHTIDLFASRLNKQLPRFFSWRPEPGAEAVDAFLQPWVNRKAYANPPFPMIGRVLQKVLREQATITVIVPLWPSQAWFPTLKYLLTDWPILLPDRFDLFLPGHLSNAEAMDRPDWRVIAAHISGAPSPRASFRRRLSSYWSQHGLRDQSQSMMRPGDIGCLTLEGRRTNRFL